VFPKNTRQGHLITKHNRIFYVTLLKNNSQKETAKRTESEKSDDSEFICVSALFYCVIYLNCETT